MIDFLDSIHRHVLWSLAVILFMAPGPMHVAFHISARTPADGLYFVLYMLPLESGERSRFPAVQDVSLFYSVQTDSGAHPTSNSMGTVGSFPGSKA
jgi:hypothetical protein